MLSSWNAVIEYCRAAMGFETREQFRILFLDKRNRLVADEVPSQRAGLAETAHRPWPLPARPWLMGQTLYSLLFAHWAVRPEALRPLIPQPLELDLREGQAWLGVTPFVVGGLRLRGTLRCPGSRASRN